MKRAWARRSRSLAARRPSASGPFAWQVLTSLRPEAELTQRRPAVARSTLEQLRQRVPRRGRFARALAQQRCSSRRPRRVVLPRDRRAGGLRAREARVPRAGALLLGAALAVSMFPPIATVSPLYLVMRALGLRDTLAGPGPAVHDLRAAARALDPHRRSSARSPTSSTARRASTAARRSGAFRKVLLPLAAPGLATTAILVFIFSWNEFLYALTFTVVARAAHGARRDQPLRRRAQGAVGRDRRRLGDRDAAARRAHARLPAPDRRRASPRGAVKG